MTTSRLLLLFLGRLLTVARSGDSLSVLLVFVDGPVEDVIVLKRFTDEQVTEDLAQVGIVWLVVKAERTSVVEIDGEFVRETAAEHLCWGGHLLLHDSIVLLLLGGSLQSLPWERATTEVEHDVSERFHIITTGLFYKR